MLGGIKIPKVTPRGYGSQYDAVIVAFRLKGGNGYRTDRGRRGDAGTGIGCQNSAGPMLVCNKPPGKRANQRDNDL